MYLTFLREHVDPSAAGSDLCLAYISLYMSGIVIGGQYNVYNWKLIIACIDYILWGSDMMSLL